MGRIEPVEPAELERVLARVLAPLGGAAPAGRAHVRSFLKYVSACALEWTAFRYRRGQRETGLLLVLFLPGNTAIAMFPPPGSGNITLGDQRRLLAAGLEQLALRKLYYVQALVEPQAAGQRELLREAGFRHLTQLIYLERGVNLSWSDPPGVKEASWISYDERRHSAFARVLVATYEDSRDCPELTDLRPIEAAIASHKAAGQFDPALWEIACVNGEHAGCILLSPLTHGPFIEIVYMGVAGRWRRRGVGSLLLRRAVQQCRRLGARKLTAVVDRRNTPACQLYARFGFKQTAAREAYIHL